MNALLFFRKSLAAALVAAGTLVVVSPFALAQSPPDKHVHSPAADNSATDGDLTAQFRSLQKKVADLEAALQSQHASRYGTNSSGQSAAMPNMPTPDSADPALSNAKMGDKKMGMMKGMKGMGSMRQDAGGQPMSSGGMGMGMMGNEVGGMKGMSRGSGGMGMMSGMGGMPGGMGMGGQGMGMMKGIGMMGRNPAMKSSMNGMGSMGSMDMPSALPGFAGASHLYHIGETGFFLDHPQHIPLTDEQQLQLNKIKESSLLATATSERKIDEAEQELWTLTAEAQPDINKIEAKAREIAQLQVDNRLAFIRSVGKAAQVLTEEQRQILVGMVATEDSPKSE